jgi:hypothetical protein
MAAFRGGIVALVDGDIVFEPDTIRWLVVPLFDFGVAAVSGNTKVGNPQRARPLAAHRVRRRLQAHRDRQRRRHPYRHLGRRHRPDDRPGRRRLENCLRGSGPGLDRRARDAAPAVVAALPLGLRDDAGVLEAPACDRPRPGHRPRGARTHMGRIGIPYLTLFRDGAPGARPAGRPARPRRVAVHLRDGDRDHLGAVRRDPDRAGSVRVAHGGERLRTLWARPLQQVVYRQLLYLVVLESVVSALAGTRLRWHKLDRARYSRAGPSGQLTHSPATDNDEEARSNSRSGHHPDCKFDSRAASVRSHRGPLHRPNHRIRNRADLLFPAPM